jgi:hypothetical protein
LKWVDDPGSAHDTQEAVAKAVDAGYCFGMMDGVMQSNDALKLLTSNKGCFCLPEGGIQKEEGIRIVVKYLEDHPAELHYGEWAMAYTALRNAFPCADRLKPAKP